MKYGILDNKNSYYKVSTKLKYGFHNPSLMILAESYYCLKQLLKTNAHQTQPPDNHATYFSYAK